MASHRLAAASALLLLAVLVGGEAREPDVEPADAGGYRTYIIMVEPPPAASRGGQEGEMMDADAHRRAWYQSFLPSETTALGEPRLRWSYRTVFDGFSARLTEEELKQVSAKPGFIRSFPNANYYLQDMDTTGGDGGLN